MKHCYEKSVEYRDALETHQVNPTHKTWQRLQEVKRAIDKGQKRPKPTTAQLRLGEAHRAALIGEANPHPDDAEASLAYRTIRVRKAASIGAPNPYQELETVYREWVDRVAPLVALALENRKRGYQVMGCKVRTTHQARNVGRDSEICAMYADGLGFLAISRAVGCAKNTVMKVIREAGIYGRGNVTFDK